MIDDFKKQSKIVNRQLTGEVFRLIVKYILLILFFIIAMPLVVLAGLSPQELEKAKGLYGKYCSQCHGEEGAGDGPAAEFFNPRPRDFTFGWYKFRSTRVEGLPTDSDLLITITDGLPATGMPGFKDYLPEGERRLLSAYIKGFSERFNEEKPLTPLSIGDIPPITEESVARGKEVFEKELECTKCHGLQGRADGPSVPGMMDDWGFPIKPRNFHKGWQFRRGSDRASIFNTVYNGITGTPMPAFRDSFEDEGVAREKIWDVTNYVYKRFVKEKPELKQAIKVKLIKGDLPLDPENPLWNEAEAVDIPLVGQVIIEPRWFSPSIDMVTVRGLHNGSDIALLLQWDDNSESNPAKADIQEAPGEEIGGEDSLPDRFVVQFPAEPVKGSAKPYFIGGDGRNPVYLWSWKAGEGLSEMKSKGFGKESVFDNTEVRSKAVYKDGQWSLVFRREITVEDKDRLSLSVGEFTPIAFNAMDGSAGEEGTKRAISTWYYLVLEAPTPLRVYIFPPIALIAGVFFEFWLMRKVRGRNDK